MKTTKINLSNLRNEEHFQFQTEFRALIDQFGATNLNIENAYTTYLLFYPQEEEALQVIRKSAITEKLTKIDMERDDLFRGLSDAVKSAINHFSKEKRDAAERLQVVLDQYGSIARKPYNEETAAIYKLVQEIQGKHATDAETIAITEWVSELNIKNMAFDSLMKGRYSDEATKTGLRMKLVRINVDAAYRGIIDLIDALMLINGTNSYEAFVRELNSRVEKYNNILAQRKGRNVKYKSNNEMRTDLKH